MTEHKHTRGPWIFDTINDAITTEERKRTSKTRIATVHLGWAEPFESEQFANAQLITAAPDLLEALIELADTGAEAWGEDRPCVRWAYTVITMATGGSNV